MNKFFRTAVVPAVLAGIIATPALSGAPPTASDAAVQGAFASGFDSSKVDLLNEDEMSSTTGQIAPLIGVIGTIVGIDLALSGLFWGVYLPNYGGGGACANCGNNNISLQ